MRVTIILTVMIKINKTEEYVLFSLFSSVFFLFFKKAMKSTLVNSVAHVRRCKLRPFGDRVKDHFRVP